MNNVAIDKLIEDQFQIFNNAAREIKNNVVKFHREHCEEHSPNCEEVFLQIFKIGLEERIQRAAMVIDIDERRAN